MHIKNAILLTLLVSSASLYCMDEPMDLDNTDNTDEPHTNKSGYVVLTTKPMPWRLFNDEVRSSNLLLIVQNLQENVSRIQALPISNAEKKHAIIARLQEIELQASDLQKELSCIAELTMYNQRLLQDKIDQFSDIDFDEMQPKFKKQVDALALQANNIQSEQVDALLGMLTNFQIK